MTRDQDTLIARLDRIGVARMARSAGLPPELAEQVASVVVQTGLPDDRRGEVYRELVAHFEDGLAAGQTPAALLASFGDGGVAAGLIRREKRLITGEAAGGTGRGDGLPLRLLRDVRYAVRRLAARPLFTATAILSLALGIGANAAMFTLVNDMVLRKPAFDAPDRLVELYYNGRLGPFNPLAYPELEDIARSAPEVFSDVGGTRFFPATRSDGDLPERLTLELVTSNYFRLLGLRAGRGRLIEPADAPAPGTGNVVVLTDAYWRQSFGADPGAVGRTIRLAGGEYTILGVAPPDFPGSFRGVRTDVFAPVMMGEQLDPTSFADNQFTNRGNNSTFAKARLRPGATLEQARVALARLAGDFKAARLGAWQADDQFAILPFSDVIIWPPLDRLLVPMAWMLTAVVGLVLVIACANLAAFLLARAVDRRKEIAVRLALGATRRRIVSQLLVETVLLALVGGVVGVALGRTALRLITAAELPFPVQMHLGLALDWRVLVFAIAVSIAAGVLFGLAPALQSTRLDLASVIRDESTGGGRRKGTLRGVLVGGQVAVCVVLLIAAGLFVRSFDAVRTVDPGFGRAPTALAWVGVPEAAEPSKGLRKLEEFRRRIGELPGVRAVGAMENIHLNVLSSTTMGVLVDGVEPLPGRDFHDINRSAVDTGFIAAAGLTLEAGRNFTFTDDSAAPPVAIVNTAFVDRFWPGEQGLGRTFRDGNGTRFEIVGIVNTARIRSLAEEPTPFVYVPLAQRTTPVLWLLARTDGNADLLVPAMLRAIRDVDPDALIIQGFTMARHLSAMSLPIKLGATSLGVFALIALIMASVGLYGTVSYSVAQRTREMGIRISLGADRAAVVRLLLWSGLRLVAAGAAVGLVVAVLAAQLVRSQLFGVAAIDPVTFVAVPLVLAAVAFVAAYIPARRAGRVNPIVALRTE